MRVREGGIYGSAWLLDLALGTKCYKEDQVSKSKAR